VSMLSLVDSEPLHLGACQLGSVQPRRRPGARRRRQ
jgi:hypothetical protein